jgi:hypothetical protein
MFYGARALQDTMRFDAGWIVTNERNPAMDKAFGRDAISSASPELHRTCTKIMLCNLGCLSRLPGRMSAAVWGS